MLLIFRVHREGGRRRRLIISEDSPKAVALKLDALRGGAERKLPSCGAGFVRSG